MKWKDWKKIHDYCMKKVCVYETRPFGKYPICYRVAGKIFAQLTPKEDRFMLTLKTDPIAASIYRNTYPGVVVRGYHCPPVQQPYWNTIDLNEFDEALLWQMLDEAYEEVIKKLSKKERERLPILSRYHFEKTDGINPAFVKLCERLDEQLDEMVGKKTQRAQYAQYNGLENIHDVIIVYDGEEAIGCGSYKGLDEETAELKRVFLDDVYRGNGIAKELVRRIEADARKQGFRFMVLETGAHMEAAIRLYAKSGYKIIPNYGPYAKMPQSVCMQKKL